MHQSLSPATQTQVPELRVRALNTTAERPNQDYVLYWMIGSRRTRFNFALQHAVGQANALRKPLLVLEALRCDYRWASARHHRFIADGMAANAKELDCSKAARLTYLEREASDGKGLLHQLAQRACCVVTDDAPVFFLNRMITAAAQSVPVMMEAVDSNGLLPLRAASKVFLRAYDLRRFLQRELPPHLLDMPSPAPLDELETPWPETLDPTSVVHSEQHRAGLCSAEDLANIDPLIVGLPIDTSVSGGASSGGQDHARALLNTFLNDRLGRYQEDRSALDHRATSELSPHLHYGHISSHEILARLAEREDWTPMQLEASGRGQRIGWWGMREATEGFLDELVTWRELGYNMAWQNPHYTSYDSLPDWARATLLEHQNDERPYLYTLEQLDQAETHDDIWNAAQRELREDGRIHNYLRMLWGKKILEWSPTPRDAADVMIELNNRYALDGRDPNSYSGIYWCLGRYDRAWGPERPIFGKIRYMSSENTRRKLKLKSYLERYGPQTVRTQNLF